MKKFLPIIIAVVGLAGGLTAGSFLKPSTVAANAKTAEAGADDHSDDAHGDDHADADNGHDEEEYADEYSEDGEKVPAIIYVGLKKPFFAPVIGANNRQTLVRLDIHLEVPNKMENTVHRHEPRLRDGFLRTVMNFAHEGGFKRVHGSEGFEVLSDDLLLSAREVLGDEVKAVLIGEILTRDVS